METFSSVLALSTVPGNLTHSHSAPWALYFIFRVFKSFHTKASYIYLMKRLHYNLLWLVLCSVFHWEKMKSRVKGTHSLNVWTLRTKKCIRKVTIRFMTREHQPVLFLVLCVCQWIQDDCKPTGMRPLSAVSTLPRHHFSMWRHLFVVSWGERRSLEASWRGLRILLHWKLEQLFVNK